MKTKFNSKEVINYTMGITLISLVVTIIILIILAGVALSLTIGENGIISRASKSSLMTELAGYKEEFELYIGSKYLEDINFNEESLNAGKTTLIYDTQKEGEEGDIRTVIPSISDYFFDKFEIIKGELTLNSSEDEEIETAQALNIKVNPYNIVDGVLTSSNNNLTLITDNGVVVIPETVTAIGEGAFSSVKGLKEIIIPGSVKEIRKNAFSYNTEIEKVILQKGVEIIGEYAFINCTNLKEIDLPDSLTTIKDSAFASSGIEHVEIPGNVLSISNYAFADCEALTNVKLNEGIETIKAGAFSSCTNLVSIKFPTSLKNIENNVFMSCKKLINIDTNLNNYFVFESGMLMNKEKDNIIFLSDEYLKNITTFEIPEGIKNFSVEIRSYKNITKIIIPSTMQSIYSGSFPTSINSIEISSANNYIEEENGLVYTKSTNTLLAGFTKEEVINIREGTTIINSSSLSKLTNAKIINFPDSVQIIGEYIFGSDNTKLEQINIGKNVSSISSVFKCGNFYGTVNIDSRNENYEVENNTLYSKGKKELICVLYKINGTYTMDNNVETIKDKAFYGQNDMTQITLSNKLKAIENNAFLRCNLKSIEIPSSIETIGTTTFEECDKLEQVIIHKEKGTIDNVPWGIPIGDRAIIWDK